MGILKDSLSVLNSLESWFCQKIAKVACWSHCVMCRQLGDYETQSVRLLSTKVCLSLHHRRTELRTACKKEEKIIIISQRHQAESIDEPTQGKNVSTISTENKNVDVPDVYGSVAPKQEASACYEALASPRRRCRWCPSVYGGEGQENQGPEVVP